MVIDEFNCNHQADSASSQMTIYTREKEEQQIQDFLRGNIQKSRSGLMYLCGHPGTGKTSLLNQVIAQMSNDEEVSEFELFQYNAMTYSDVRSFGLTLLCDLNERRTGLAEDRLSR